MLKYEDDLICDFAEFYHIYNIKSFTPLYIATLAVGLRYNSRIILKLNNQPVSQDQVLLAGIFDNLNMIRYMLSGGKGGRKPDSVMEKLIKRNTEITTFSSSDDFERAKERILKNSRKEVDVSGNRDSESIRPDSSINAWG